MEKLTSILWEHKGKKALMCYQNEGVAKKQWNPAPASSDSDWVRTTSQATMVLDQRMMG